MPYNTSAIPPRQDITGHAQLPLSRVKKIIALDSDISMCSNNAAFVITLATEMFIQTLAEQGHNVVKSERKPRRNIQYRDLANAVARSDALEFLSDVIPRTIPYKEIKAGRATQPQARQNGATEAGQTTLDGRRPQINGSNGESSNTGIPQSDGAGDDSRIDDDESADPNAQLEMEIRERGRTEGASGGEELNGNGIHAGQNGHADEDVEMR